MTRDSIGRPNVIVDEVIDNAPTGIYIKDPEGKYLYVNKHYEDAIGIPRDEILGRTDLDLYPPEAATAYGRDDLLSAGAVESQMAGARIAEGLGDVRDRAGIPETRNAHGRSSPPSRNEHRDRDLGIPSSSVHLAAYCRCR